jgi:exosortase/archaeosortase family protein
MKINRKIGFLILRYILAIILALCLPLFYIILKPITIYPIFLITQILYNSSLQGIILTINSHSIEFVNACIAGSAYLLLFILNLVTPMNYKKRIYMFLFGFFLFLLFNLARILILIILLMNNMATFDITHKITWYGISTLFVVLIWFINIRIFKIKRIPIYSDIRFILNQKRK